MKTAIEIRRIEPEAVRQSGIDYQLVGQARKLTYT